MDCLCFSTSLSASFGFGAGGLAAMCFTDPFVLERRGAALLLCALGLGLAAWAGDATAQGEDGLF